LRFLGKLSEVILDYVNMKEVWVGLKEDYVNLKEVWVGLKQDYVNLKEVWVGLKEDWVDRIQTLNRPQESP
jgi:hypothetical protein